ncbi:bifunctional 3'-5' exonuclease/DNA polymerase [Actinoplanes rectilineatus]|uniref:bifunctional 3'-5' exonuclease/DNA polymerase n=1 Tax=Actinoplanes rectilineatus TaxID=113571 RepID=UPI0005F2FA5F|nr:bifunctional 3'-5' exonuclease/DNA polymerase [Actinoplanes rectilineatus]
MLVAVTADPGGAGGLLADLTDGGPPRRVPDLAAVVAEREAAEHPRWVWASTADVYPALLRAGVRVARCHDLELTEALLSGHDGRWGEPRGVPAAIARLRGLSVPADLPRPEPSPPGFAQEALFDTVSRPAADIADLIAVHAEQQRRIRDLAEAGRFRMLVAAESAGALIAVEMGHAGLPWRADLHDEILRELLGPPQPVGPPRRLAELTAAINEAFGVHGLHPDSPAEVVRAFARAGVQIPSTRRWILQQVDHPAVAPLLDYKELYRIWTAHGWAWCDAWVRDGRFRPEFVPGGVVSGRWATRGGGALQVPKVIRRAVVADPGWTFVVADAGQLEPRVLAAVSGDGRLARAAAAGDLYAALATDSFAGDRAKAKLALLGAMYGQTGGDALPALAVLRRHYPTAFDYVEAAARTGENGGLVRSWLGRTCPPASREAFDGLDPPDEVAPPPGRSRGRFTRNFVIQATAAEWALVMIATLRTALEGTAAELVLFVHDEIVVHCPAGQADAVVAAVHDSAARAGRLLFGDTTVRFPLDVSVVGAYADAK